MQSKQNKIQITTWQRYLWSMNKLEELPLKPKNKHQPYRILPLRHNNGAHTCSREKARAVRTETFRHDLRSTQSTENGKPAVFRQVQHVPQGLCRLPVVHGGSGELRSDSSVVVGGCLLTRPPFQLGSQVPVGKLGGNKLLLLEHQLVGPFQGVVVVDARSRRGGEVRHRGEVI